MKVTPGVKEKDHQYITITLKLPSPVQHEYRSKNKDSKVAFADPPENYQPPNIVIPNFEYAITNQNVEKAWHLWSHASAELFAKIPFHGENSCNSHVFAAKGKVRFARQRTFPKQFEESAATLKTVRWAKILRQTEELQRLAFFGRRAQITWTNCVKQIELTHFDSEQAQHVRQVAKSSLSKPAVQEIVSQVPTVIEQVRKREKFDRINSWKRRMKTSKKEVHKWLRKNEAISTGVMMNKDGKPTANKDDMFNLIRDAWDKVFNKYSRGEPDSNLFFQNLEAT